MKSIYIKAVAAIALAAVASSCGDDFLDTKIYNGVDLEKGLSTVPNISNALNGTYYRFFNYRFAGNYATTVGDIASDLPYWNGKTQHQDAWYRFATLEDDVSLLNIWDYGYKVIDNSSRVIEACGKMLPDATADEAEELNLDCAEALALRGYSTWQLVNIFGHQIKVNGADFTSEPGVVIVDTPIEAYSEVKRSTVGECYAAIVSDLRKSIEYFEKAGVTRESLFYFSPEAVYGLLARVYLYMEDFTAAADCAQKAIDMSGITTLAYTREAYKALYYGGESNVESMFALDINSRDNWSANSCGTQWSTYSYSPSPWLLSIYGENDVRRVLIAYEDADDGTPSDLTTTPVYASGKFSAFASGNSAYGTNYLVNAPEMYLIIAEANVRSAAPDLDKARQALLVVAKRNLDITSVDDLPADAAGIMAFLKDERARELFQEGQRLYDLRRWDVAANVYAYKYPEVAYTYTGYKISNFLFPIPDDEINAGFGVEQTPGWSNVLPGR